MRLNPSKCFTSAHSRRTSCPCSHFACYAAHYFHYQQLPATTDVQLPYFHREIIPTELLEQTDPVLGVVQLDREIEDVTFRSDLIQDKRKMPQRHDGKEVERSENEGNPFEAVQLRCHHCRVLGPLHSRWIHRCRWPPSNREALGLVLC